MPFRNRTSDIIDGFLLATVSGSVIVAGVIAPNSLIALQKPLEKLLNGRDKQKEARKIGRYMKQQNLVLVTDNHDGSFTVQITRKGRTRAKRAHFESITIPDSKWDEKWRIVMFDIPEKYKTTRDYISRHLQRIGFIQVQRSIFVFPYPIDEFIEILYELFPEVKNDVHYLTTSEIDIHNQLVKRFRHII